jgi:hypothetical protein
MKLGFTGTQDGRAIKLSRWTEFCVFIVNHLSDIEEFHHGDCIGADATADAEVYRIFGSLTKKPVIHIHPPINGAKRAFCPIHRPGFEVVVHEKKDYLVRNRDIVDACDTIYAMPRDPDKMELRSGTWSTVRYALSPNKKRDVYGISHHLGGQIPK